MTPSRCCIAVLVALLAGCASQEEVGWVPGDPARGPFAPPSRGLAPMTGGTLTVVDDGRGAVVSDSDRDAVSLVDLQRGVVRQTLRLPAGSWPTRAAEMGDDTVALLLRGTGQLARIDLKTGTLVGVESICGEPRSLTWDSTHERLLVGCADGAIVSRSAGGTLVTTRVDAEIRDLALGEAGLVVSTFRSPQLLAVDEAGQVAPLGTPPSVPFGVYLDAPVAFVPNTAWRTVRLPNGNVAMVHQRSVAGDVRAPTALAGPEIVRETVTTLVPRVSPGSGYYGGDVVVNDEVTTTTERRVCTTGVVRSAVTIFAPDGQVRGSHEIAGILPIDAAVSPNGTELAVIAAGNHQVVRVDLTGITSVEGRACGVVQARVPDAASDALGQPSGVAYRPDGTLVVHTRQPARLLVVSSDGAITKRIGLPAGEPYSTPGHTLFHTATSAVACASCHPEAAEDGHVWNFLGSIRRTQPLTGGLSATAPFHWGGELTGMHAVVEDTFVRRMGGTKVASSTVDDLTAFLDPLPAPKARGGKGNAALLERGKQVYELAGCGTCHSGTRLTNNTTVDVGTGGVFQVPSLLGVGARAPYMHNGCAATLLERFTKPGCGGARHGNLSAVTDADLDALTSYLQIL